MEQVSPIQPKPVSKANSVAADEADQLMKDANKWGAVIWILVLKYQTLTILLNPDTHIPAKYVADLVFFIRYFYLRNLLFPRTAVTLFFTSPFFFFNFSFFLIINPQEERIASPAAPINRFNEGISHACIAHI